MSIDVPFTVDGKTKYLSLTVAKETSNEQPSFISIIVGIIYVMTILPIVTKVQSKKEKSITKKKGTVNQKPFCSVIDRFRTSISNTVEEKSIGKNEKGT